MYLLDTNHCSWIINGAAAVCARVQALGETPIATTVITWGELVHMAHKSRQTAENLRRVKEFLEDIAVYRVDESTADVYGAFKGELLRHFGPKRSAQRDKARLHDIGVSENDLWIASIAIAHGLTIVSADRDFQRMREVRTFSLETWAIRGSTSA